MKNRWIKNNCFICYYTYIQIEYNKIPSSHDPQLWGQSAMTRSGLYAAPWSPPESPLVHLVTLKDTRHNFGQWKKVPSEPFCGLMGENAPNSSQSKGIS